MARKGGPKRMTLGHPKVDRLIEALTIGDFIDDACKYANINEATYYRWLREGRDIDAKVDAGEAITPEEASISELCQALKEAELKGQHAALATIRRAAKEGTWQAAAWLLERRNKKWSNRTEVTGPDGGPVNIVTPEDVDAKLRGLIDAYRAEHEIAE